jgi:hypothetical protein
MLEDGHARILCHSTFAATLYVSLTRVQVHDVLQYSLHAIINVIL